jgi:Tol biopolymer transport system component
VTFIRQKEEGELQALFAVDIDGTNERRVVPYRFNVFIKHDWLPNGRRLVFTGTVDGRINVYTVAPDGSHRRRLTNAREGWGSGRGFLLAGRANDRVSICQRGAQRLPLGEDAT